MVGRFFQSDRVADIEADARMVGVADGVTDSVADSRIIADAVTDGEVNTRMVGGADG